MVQYLGNLFLSGGWSGTFPAEIREQKATAGRRIQAPNQPTEGKERESSSPWLRSAVTDSMARLYAGTRCAASGGSTERLFCCLSMGDLCRSRREGPAAPPRPLPDPRRPGTCRLRGAGWRRAFCVLRHTRPFSASLEMSKWSWMPSARGLCSGRGGAESWKQLEITPCGQTERLVCCWLWQGRRAGQDIPSLS